MAPIMGPEETLSGIFLDWSSLLLVLFVLGIGYIGLVLISFLRGVDIYKIPLYDKIIRSALLGFISFTSILSFIGINITSQEDIFKLIGTMGVALIMFNAIVCIGISYLIYLIFYFLPNIEIRIKKIRENPKKKKKV